MTGQKLGDVLSLVAGVLCAVFAVWVVRWPETWLSVLEKTPAKAIFFTLAVLFFTLLCWNIRSYFRTPSDAAHALHIAFRFVSSISLAVGGLPVGLSLVQLVAVNSAIETQGRSEVSRTLGEVGIQLGFSQVGIGASVVVCVCAALAVLCAFGRVHLQLMKAE